MTYVGVTGHRQLFVDESLIAGIDEALVRIAEAFGGEPLTIVSALAEGADCLVVERAARLGARRHIAILPMAEAEYVETFSSDTATRELRALLASAETVVRLPPSSSEVEAYRAAERWMLAHANALIAVWDGTPALGEGGTGDVVVEARALGMPLAWIVAGRDRQDMTTRRSTVAFERLPCAPLT